MAHTVLSMTLHETPAAVMSAFFAALSGGRLSWYLMSSRGLNSSRLFRCFPMSLRRILCSPFSGPGRWVLSPRRLRTGPGIPGPYFLIEIAANGNLTRRRTHEPHRSDRLRVCDDDVFCAV